jgi:hypothetical protein
VGNAVSHAFHASPRHIGVLIGKIFVVFEDFGSYFTNNDEVQDHRLLRSFVF